MPCLATGTTVRWRKLLEKVNQRIVSYKNQCCYIILKYNYINYTSIYKTFAQCLIHFAKGNTQY